MKLINSRGKPDYILLTAVVALALIGLLFIYSASYYMAERDFSNKFYYFTKQAVGFVVGVVAMLLASRLNLDLLKKLALPLLLVSLVLLGLVFVPGLGIENYGAKRWIGFGGFSFQPSEIAKFAFVFFAATYMSRQKTDMTRLAHALPVLGSGLAVCLLIILEPNMSITMCVGLVMLIMLFIGGMKPKWFVLLIAAAAVAVPVMILVEPYRLKRLLAFIDPWASPKDEGYQLIQSLYALGSGGWFGVGLFNSRQKYSFLPFAESDFVFSVIGEETGLVGCLLLMLLFLLVIYRGVKISLNAPDKFSSLLCGGVVSIIAVQSAINLAVVTGSIPPTGLPLPFISYGGTSLVMFMFAAGLLLNVSRSEEALSVSHL